MSIGLRPRRKQSLATGAAFDARRPLWVAWVGGAHVVDPGDDAGRTLSVPVTVYAVPERICTRVDNRPRLATSPAGRAVCVSWSMPFDAGWRGEMSRTVWIGREGVRAKRAADG
ncbi:hypothetical protein WS95_01630 [Burkholderia sp. MSMB1826]|uniref:Glycosyl hydrolase BNR repeat-containing domain protein n=1 Tax=Burkholderia cepacia TaxID=292 RepID=A0AA88Z356_BURCE|nr:glycosyl hydrolase BNR repeat-containing domain protein [Burkholderia cepacia]KVL16963.1 hypothetical protein WS95_01630 [Burkholderia sp. MSMB1826]KWE61610.1 hypothetical protein WT53_01660 [Burkholderia sp. MSMB2157WGS]